MPYCFLLIFWECVDKDSGQWCWHSQEKHNSDFLYGCYSSVRKPCFPQCNSKDNEDLLMSAKKLETMWLVFVCTTGDLPVW